MTINSMPPAAIQLLQFLSRGDASRTEIAALQLPHQSRVLTLLFGNRLIEWKSPSVCAITDAGRKCLELNGER